MSLPGLNFNEWNVLHPSQDDENEVNNGGEYKTLTKHSHTNLKTNKSCNDASAISGANHVKCKTCYELKINRRHSSNIKQFSNCINNSSNNNLDNINNNYNENSGALKCCKYCYKSIDTENDNDMQPKVMKTINLNNNNNNITNNNSIDDNGKFNFKLPRRNLSLKRQQSKEIETRALISRVAQYYESYVTEMKLDNYFQNDTIVTTILPLKLESNTGKFEKAQWTISG